MGSIGKVVYACGALRHDRELVIPCGMSDCAASFATVSPDELLARCPDVPGIVVAKVNCFGFAGWGFPAECSSDREFVWGSTQKPQSDRALET